MSDNYELYFQCLRCGRKLSSFNSMKIGYGLQCFNILKELEKKENIKKGVEK